ncbi:MAG: T9SS type A sorting domain-containing protein [Flavobacteriaceae bacterium]|nr:T9SS type A sorting domain-containing protein [Mangrovimonas sp.]MCB0470214.1 T9SS type A sorting domain-containing protein [Flavobacteriaceae bacterium]MCB0427416.1 T9SS type A sorting domain-containing protein [Mangrovimonas sp.]MCB0431535.1 T9SS type A sorting domain-containing protein [Mangrovimonas sp.]MCB0435828.1 T9SS type A sorting domain-containing protein [Mangrovimonas sp.]
MKFEKLEGDLEKFLTTNIYLNVNHLDKGVYQLKIIHKNKVIKTTKFIKH